jgi:hypothetical protein
MKIGRPQFRVGDDLVGVDKLAIGILAHGLGNELHRTGTQGIVVIEEADPFPTGRFNTGVCRQRDPAILPIQDDLDVVGLLVARQPGLRPFGR